MFGFNRKTRLPQTHNEEVQYVDDQYKIRREERIGFELQWRLNLAFIEGNQFLDVNPYNKMLQEIPRMHDYEERECFNQIAPVMETRYSRLSRLRPILKSRPATTQQKDIHAAKVGSTLLRNVYYEKGIGSLMNECYAWMETCGCVLTKNGWDPEKGLVLANYVEMMQDPEGEWKAEEIVMREGDLAVAVCPSHEIFPDSSYRQKVSACRSILHVKAYHVDEVADIWNVKVDPEDVVVTQLQKAMVGLSGLGYGLGNYMFANVKLKEHALVKEMWMRPSREYPRGRLIIVANKIRIYSGPLPYEIGDDGDVGLPFVKLDCIERPGVFWGKSVVERLIPLQRRYNAVRNRKAEYLNRAAIGGLWVEEGSVDMDDVEANANTPGYIGRVNRGYKFPQERQLPPLPDAFNIEEHNLLQEFNMLAGTSDLTRMSKAPPGVKSGKAISLSLEQDDARQHSTALNVEQFLVENGKQWLRLTRQFKKAPDILRSVGEDNLVEVIDWCGADLVKADDVIVEALSPMLESPIQRRQLIFDLLGAGLLVDPETGRIDKDARAKVFEMLQLGNWEAGDSEEQLHISRAKRENLGIENGQMPMAVVYDDHVLHVKYHNKHRLTAEYEALISQNPVVDQIFRHHVDQHLLAMAFQAQQMMAPVLQGGPPGPPGQPAIQPAPGAGAPLMAAGGPVQR